MRCQGNLLAAVSQGHIQAVRGGLAIDFVGEGIGGDAAKSGLGGKGGVFKIPSRMLIIDITKTAGDINVAGDACKCNVAILIG